MNNTDSTSAADSPQLTPLAKPFSKIHLIETRQDLAQVVQALENTAGPIAVDAERASGFKYSQRAYLIQLKAESSDIFLIDPVSDEQMSQSVEFAALRELLSKREWILHAATQDLPCLNELQLHPSSIFDTELAGRLSGQPRVGLGSLVETMLGIGLAKEHSAADWSTRPLPESWLNYAALDVELLHQLRAKFIEMMELQSKQVWAEQEFNNLLSFKPKPQRTDRWRSITGLNKISDQHTLEIARQLWLAREELAIKIDVSPGRLIPDSSILSAATTKPKTKPELASLRSFNGRASRSYLDYWWQALQSANRATDLPAVRADKPEGIPNHRNWAAKFPDADERLRHAKTALTELSETLAVPLENLLTPDTLRQICFAPPEPATVQSVEAALTSFGARAWQVELTAQLIAEAISRSDEPDPKQPTPQE